MSDLNAISRRNVFNHFVGASVAATTTFAQVKSAFAESVNALTGNKTGWDTDSSYWEKIRQQFMIDDGLAYLNTGTLGPTPKVVVGSMNEYWQLMAANPNENSVVLQDRQDRIRVKAAAFVGVKPDEIALTRNTTEGTTILVQGMDFKPGDEVLITKYEHNSLRETRRRHAKRFGYVLKEIEFPLPYTNAQVISAFEAAITPRTRVMHFANPLGGSGSFMPVRELAALAHSKSILCFIDGAHAPGMIRVNLSEWGVDGFACNSHKWLCGAAGAGLLFVRQDIQDRIWPNISIAHEDPKGARKYDQLSRRPWPVVAAFEDILDFHNAIGPERIEARTRELGSYLRRNAAKISRVKVYTPMEATMSCGSTNLGIDDVPGARLREHLRQNYDAYVPAGKTSLRVSTHFFNTFEQCDRVLSALQDLSNGAS
jgi:isopenicillin-N epimerase